MEIIPKESNTNERKMKVMPTFLLLWSYASLVCTSTPNINTFFNVFVMWFGATGLNGSHTTGNFHFSHMIKNFLAKQRIHQIPYSLDMVLEISGRLPSWRYIKMILIWELKGHNEECDSTAGGHTKTSLPEIFLAVEELLVCEVARGSFWRRLE